MMVPRGCVGNSVVAAAARKDITEERPFGTRPGSIGASRRATRAYCEKARQAPRFASTHQRKGLNVSKLKFGTAIFLATAFLCQPVKAQQTTTPPSLPSLLSQGFEIKGMSYNIGVLVQKGSVVYVCGWAADNKSACVPIN